jgi:hypothetical protein
MKPYPLVDDLLMKQGRLIDVLIGPDAEQPSLA